MKNEHAHWAGFYHRIAECNLMPFCNWCRKKMERLEHGYPWRALKPGDYPPKIRGRQG